MTSCCLLALQLGLAYPVAGQGLAGKPIRQIDFEGLQFLSEETLLFYLGLEPGSAYDAAVLNDNIHALWEKQLIESLEITAEPFEDGVRLVFDLVERPTLRSIEYQGLKRVSNTDIQDRIARDRLRVREGDPLDLGDLQRLKAAIEDLYREKGFRLAEATYAIEPVDVGERRVLFTIDEGDKVRIEDIDFEGNTVFGDRRLRWAMGKTKESGLLTSLFKKDVFKSAVFEEDLDSVRGIYRKAGYKNVVLGEPQVEVRAVKPGAETAKKQKRRLFLTIPVEEGARWKFGEITIQGNERFSDELLLRQFEKASGGWLRSTVIDKGVETINELYHNTGHLFADVKTELVERDDQVADLIVNINEGDRFSVGRIEFEGNVKTRDKVLRRELSIQEGLVLNSGALKNSLLRIRQLEFFRVNEDDPVAFDFDNENKLVDLTIKGEEGDRTELLFGGGFSEIDGFFGQFAFKSRNFLGRGETLGVSIQSGARQDIFDVSYYVPWWLDRPQSAGIQLYSRSLDYNLLGGQNLQQRTRGGSLTYGRNLGLFRNVSIGLSSFSSRDRRSQFNSTGELVQQEFDRNVNSLRLSHVFDRRDSRLQPTTGMRYTGSIEYAGSFLGGNTDFIRPQASFSFFQPVSKTRLTTVLAFNIEAGYIRPLSGELFFNDRFYTGGENSLRGFRFRSIWARDEDGNTITDEFGFPLGGDRLLQVNLEYILVLGGPFRILAFADTAGVWAEQQSLDFGSMRYTAGVELQVNVPVFGAPLRFIWSNNLDPLVDDRFESFQFSIGPSF